jgi:hypothetical protein
LKSPLSDPDKAKPDARLFGAWRPVKEGTKKLHPTFFFIGKVEHGDAPPGIMKSAWVDFDENNIVRMDEGGYFFTTLIGDSGYANFFEKVVFDRTKFPKWDKRNVKDYVLYKYKIEGDKLTVWIMDAEATEAAIRKGQVKGTITEEKKRGSDTRKVLTVTDGESLSKFLANGGDKALFPDDDEHRLALMRVK